MLLTSINGRFKGYWYEEGYIRTSSVEFTLKDCENNYIHLTNDAVQKKGYDYGKFENGNKVIFVVIKMFIVFRYRLKNFKSILIKLIQKKDMIF